MDCSIPTPKVCILKVNFHCPACEGRVRKVLRKVNGVCSVFVDGEHGKVTVSGTVDPNTLIGSLARAGKKAELLSVHSLSLPTAGAGAEAVNHHKTAARPPQQKQHQGGLDPRTMEQLRELSKSKNLKQVELTHLRMMFSEGNSDCASDVEMESTTVFPDNVRRSSRGDNVGGGGAPPSCGDCVAGVGRNDWCDVRGQPEPPPPPVASAHHNHNLFSDDNPHGCSLM